MPIHASLSTVAIALAASVTLAACGTSTDPDSSQVTPAPVSEPVSLLETIDAGDALVLIDGWSVKTLAEDTVTATAQNDQGLDIAEPVPVRFQAATDSQVRDIAAAYPKEFTQIVARTITGSADLQCQEDGCSGTHPVDLAWFTDAASVPTYGPMYEAYDITTLLWYAVIDTPEGASTSLLQAPEGPGAYAPADAGGIEASVIGAAFDQVFPLSAYWLTDNQAWRYLPPVVTVNPTDIEQAALVSTDLPGLSLTGLSNPWPGSQGMDATQLTYHSSPTAGCGIGALCVPEDITTQSLTVQQEPVTLCPVTGGDDNALLANQVRVSGTVTVPGPTNMFGLNGTDAATDMTDIPEQGGVAFGGFPTQLADGTTTVNLATIVVTNPTSDTIIDILGSAGGDEIDPESINLNGPWEIAGTTWQACG